MNSICVKEAAVLDEPGAGQCPRSVAPEGSAPGTHAWESFFLSCLPVINATSRMIARRYRMTASDQEEFASIVLLRIIAGNYAVLRRFRGRSTLQRYLAVVIGRMFIDEYYARFGKWRPSRRMQREGPLAIQLERMTVRDGLSFDELCGMLVADGRADRDELRRLYNAIPARPPRRFVDAGRWTTSRHRRALRRARCSTLNGRQRCLAPGGP